MAQSSQKQSRFLSWAKLSSRSYSLSIFFFEPGFIGIDSRRSASSWYGFSSIQIKGQSESYGRQYKSSISSIAPTNAASFFDGIHHCVFRWGLSCVFLLTLPLHLRCFLLLHQAQFYSLSSSKSPVLYFTPLLWYALPLLPLFLALPPVFHVFPQISRSLFLFPHSFAILVLPYFGKPLGLFSLYSNSMAFSLRSHLYQPIFVRVFLLPALFFLTAQPSSFSFGHFSLSFHPFFAFFYHFFRVLYLLPFLVS